MFYSLIVISRWMCFLDEFCHRHGFVSILTTILFLIFWQDRLIALDAAEEFFKTASRTYPKKAGVPCLADGQKELRYFPFPSP